MVRKVLIGAVMLVAVFAAPAAAQYNPIVVQPANVSPGQAITITGQACKPFEHFTVTIRPYSVDKDPTRSKRSTDPGPVGYGAPIASVDVTADSTGAFSVTITIPAGTPLGQYVVETTSACVQSKVIDVVAPASTAPPPNHGGGTLSRTGSDLDKLGLAGAGLLVLGGLILVATKRRRQDHTPTVA